MLTYDGTHWQRTPGRPLKQNLGDADRTARLITGAIFGVCLFVIDLTSDQRFWPGLFTVYLLATGLSGWCPLYAILRRSTRSAKDVVPPRS